jgi:phospholipid transport system transporter-binding protein
MSVQRIAPKGSLTMANAGALCRDIAKILPDQALEIDLSGLTDIDSSAVALVVTILGSIRLTHQAITIKPLPANVMQFAEIYGLGTALNGIAVG